MTHLKQAMISIIALAIATTATTIWADSTSVTKTPKEFITYLGELNLTEYETMLAGRDPLTVDISSTALTRMTLEPLIFQVAPVLGGCDCSVKIMPYTVHTPHARSIAQIKSGKQISHPIASFPGDSRHDNSIQLSEPILDEKDFFVGLYTHEKRTDVLAALEKEAISKLRFGVGRTWEVDYRVLEKNNLNIVQADSWSSLVNMIINSRTDVMMQPFHASDDLSFIDGDSNEKFVPIPNVKIRFGEGRSYLVSVKHPDGSSFLEHLNKGINILKSNGSLHKAMIHAGVINENTDSFEVLN